MKILSYLILFWKLREELPVILASDLIEGDILVLRSNQKCLIAVSILLSVIWKERQGKHSFLVVPNEQKGIPFMKLRSWEYTCPLQWKAGSKIGSSGPSMNNTLFKLTQSIQFNKGFLSGYYMPVIAVGPKFNKDKVSASCN